MKEQVILPTISVGRNNLLEEIRNFTGKDQYKLISRFDKDVDCVKLCNDLYDGDADDCGLGYPEPEFPHPTDE